MANASVSIRKGDQIKLVTIGASWDDFLEDIRDAFHLGNSTELPNDQIHVYRLKDNAEVRKYVQLEEEMQLQLCIGDEKPTSFTTVPAKEQPEDDLAQRFVQTVDQLAAVARDISVGLFVLHSRPTSSPDPIEK